MLNYEVLANMYKSRKNHKLDEWSEGFIQWVESLPYSELITTMKIEPDESSNEKNMTPADFDKLRATMGIKLSKEEFEDLKRKVEVKE